MRVSAAAVALPFPFLPRHLTLVNAVTIGIPAFFLALGPNTRSYRPGFLRRVLRFSIPAGLIAGLTVVVSYLLASHSYGVPRSEFAARCSPADLRPGALDAACGQPGTGATVALLIVFFAILIVLARPMRPWKALLIGSMMTIAVLAFALPAARVFFDFDLPAGLAWQSLLVGAGGAVLIAFASLLVPTPGEPTD